MIGFLLGFGLFSGPFAVSFRAGILQLDHWKIDMTGWNSSTMKESMYGKMFFFSFVSHVSELRGCTNFEIQLGFAASSTLKQPTFVCTFTPRGGSWTCFNNLFVWGRWKCGVKHPTIGSLRCFPAKANNGMVWVCFMPFWDPSSAVWCSTRIWPSICLIFMGSIGS